MIQVSLQTSSKVNKSCSVHTHEHYKKKFCSGVTTHLRYFSFQLAAVELLLQTTVSDSCVVFVVCRWCWSWPTAPSSCWGFWVILWWSTSSIVSRLSAPSPTSSSPIWLSVWLHTNTQIHINTPFVCVCVLCRSPVMVTQTSISCYTPFLCDLSADEEKPTLLLTWMSIWGVYTCRSYTNPASYLKSGYICEYNFNVRQTRDQKKLWFKVIIRCFTPYQWILLYFTARVT